MTKQRHRNFRLFVSVIILCGFFPAQGFVVSIRLRTRPSLKIDQRTGSTSDDDLSWHFLPSGYKEDSTLSVFDAVLIELDAKEGTLKPHEWLRSIAVDSTKDIAGASIDGPPNHSSNPPKGALAAIDATYRWAANFVRPLQLCPWAGSSLDTHGAIRYWVMEVDASESSDHIDGIVFDHMERIIRKAGRQLEQITTADSNPINSAAAISFVILVPKSYDKEDTSMRPPSKAVVDFETFHDFFLDLEDSFLDECMDSMIDESSDEYDESEIPDGCKFTLAAFHPDWKFNSEAFSDLTEDASAIDYEKRTPYPTISIVMSSVIDSLMDQQIEEDGGENTSSVVTDRIAASNEKTLCKLGVRKLQEMFEKQVVCPFGNVKSDN